MILLILKGPSFFDREKAERAGIKATFFIAVVVVELRDYHYAKKVIRKNRE